MTALAMRTNAVDGLSTRDRRILKFLVRRLQLGEPARYETPGGQQWYVWDDHRFTLRHMAILGAFAGNVGDIPSGYRIPKKNGQVDRERLETSLRGFLSARITMPEDIAYTEDGNPWQETLDAQGAPAVIRAAGSVPNSWVPR